MQAALSADPQYSSSLTESSNLCEINRPTFISYNDMARLSSVTGPAMYNARAYYTSPPSALLLGSGPQDISGGISTQAYKAIDYDAHCLALPATSFPTTSPSTFGPGLDCTTGYENASGDHYMTCPTQITQQIDRLSLLPIGNAASTPAIPHAIERRVGDEPGGHRRILSHHRSSHDSPVKLQSHKPKPRKRKVLPDTASKSVRAQRRSKRLACEICSTECKGSHELSRHMLRHASEQGKERKCWIIRDPTGHQRFADCKKCNAPLGFPRSDNAVEHIRRKHMFVSDRSRNPRHSRSVVFRDTDFEGIQLKPNEHLPPQSWLRDHGYLVEKSVPTDQEYVSRDDKSFEADGDVNESVASYSSTHPNNVNSVEEGSVVAPDTAPSAASSRGNSELCYPQHQAMPWQPTDRRRQTPMRSFDDEYITKISHASEEENVDHADSSSGGVNPTLEQMHGYYDDLILPADPVTDPNVVDDGRRFRPYPGWDEGMQNLTYAPPSSLQEMPFGSFPGADNASTRLVYPQMQTPEWTFSPDALMQLAQTRHLSQRESGR